MAVAAGHVQGRPPILVLLVDVGAVFNQELDAIQVSGEHSFVQGCHAWMEGFVSPGLREELLNTELQVRVVHSPGERVPANPRYQGDEFGGRNKD